MATVFAVLFAVSLWVLATGHTRSIEDKETLENLSAQVQTAVRGESEILTEKSAPLRPPIQSAVLPQYREVYEQNHDLIGWIRIDGTVIDYPVMQSKADGDFYLDHGFGKKESKKGVPFVDERCPVDPMGTNTIIYGHHMKDGSMFASLLKYEDQNFYEAHSIICFSTLYEEREYDIIAVFESKTYYTTDQVFKHYNFLNAEDETDFNSYIHNIKELALYDTGVSAEYGDELITLITCSYHTENGQFVVVAKKI